MARPARARRRNHLPLLAVRQLNPPLSAVHPINPPLSDIHPINPPVLTTNTASSSSTTTTTTRTRTRTKPKTRTRTTASQSRSVTTISVTRETTSSPAFTSATKATEGFGVDPSQPDEDLPETLSSTSTSSVAASITSSSSPDPDSFQAAPTATAGHGTLTVAPSYGGGPGPSNINDAAPTPSTSDLSFSEVPGTSSTVIDSAKPETQRSADDGASSDSPVEIAVPVAVSAFLVFIAVAALFFLRHRRRHRGNQINGPEMIQDVGAGAATRSIGTTTRGSVVSSFLFGGRRAGIPNPFADAESIHSRDSYHDETSPVVAAAAVRSDSAHSHHTASSHPYATAESPFRDPGHQRDDLYGYSDSPFSDSYAAAAHHAAAMEASRFASPRLSTTPRSETPRFIFGASASSVANTAGHSSANLSTPHLAFSAPPPPVPPMPDFDNLRSPLSVMTFGTDYSGDTMSPNLVRAFPAPPAELTIPDSSRRESSRGQLIDLADSPKRP